MSYVKPLCRFFGTPRGCRYGDQCRFGHGTTVITTPQPLESSRTTATQIDPPPQTNEQEDDEFGPINTHEPYILHNRLSQKLGLKSLKDEAFSKNPGATLFQIMPPIHKEMFNRIKEYAESTSDPVGWHLLGTEYQSGCRGPTDPLKAVECFRRAADAGCLGAMHDLAICYKNGVGVKENQKTAFGLLKKAAEGGYHQSQFYVGVRYMEGNGVKRNEEAGIEWIKKSHEGGNEQAAEYLNLILGDDDDEDESREGSDADSESEVDLDFGSMAIGESDGLIDGIMRMQEIVEKLDFDAIVQYQGDNPGLSIEDVLQSHITQQLQILVDEGEPFALHQMSVFYSNGIRGIARDTKKAFELIKEASEKGYLPATHDLALCYLNGDGVQKNTKRSVELLTKAAEGGFVMSQLSLANRLLAGEGVKKDEKLGFSWVKKAAAHGHVNAIFTLGKCHWNGAGTPQSFQLAVRYFKDAASKDDGESNFYLGLAHESGLGGLRKDAEKAYQSFLACVEAEPNRATNIAMYNLGVLCFNKVTSTGRKSDAAGWFEKSETPTGHYALGFMHRLGIGARKNDRMSQQYFSRALMNGYIPAMIAMTNSRTKMPVLETIICLCNETDCEH